MPLLPEEELRSILPAYEKWWVGTLIKTVRPLILGKFQSLYNEYEQYSGPSFAEKVLRGQGCDYLIGNSHILDEFPKDGPFITISNHPYGGIDGLIMVDLLGHVRPDYKVLVNKILSLLHAMDPNFICVTPTGEERTAPTADSISGIRVALSQIRQGHPLGIFPSGAVSDLSLKDRCVRDREWQEAIIKFIRKAAVPVYPVHFLDGNSMFYYLLGLIDWKVRLLRLPKEVVNKSARKRVRVVFGDPIPPERLSSIPPEELSKFLRESVYGLGPTDDFVRRSSLGYED